MEINNSSYSVPGHDTLLTADAKESLRTTVSWAKFVAVGSFVFAGLYLIIGILFIGLLGTIFGSPLGQTEYYRGLAGMPAGIGTFYAVMLTVWAAVFFLYGYFLVMFASRTKQALASDDARALESGFRYMKNFWIYNGILIILALAIMFLTIMGLALAVSLAGI